MLTSLLLAGTAGTYTMKAEGGAATAQAVIKQRQNGLQLARQIVTQEGVRGLYRGFGASIATFVPSSAIW